MYHRHQLLHVIISCPQGQKLLGYCSKSIVVIDATQHLQPRAAWQARKLKMALDSLDPFYNLKLTG